MKLNYYIAEKLLQVEVFVPCPGCGQMKFLSMHVIIVSPVKGIHKFRVGCLCGWAGPELDKAIQAANFWDVRARINLSRKEIA